VSATAHIQDTPPADGFGGSFRQEFAEEGPAPRQEGAGPREWTVSRGQQRQWIGYYEVHAALQRLCIPYGSFRTLVADGVIPVVRFGEHRRGTRYAVPTIEALAPVIDRFVHLSDTHFDRWWETVGGRLIREAPDYADSLCFFRDPEVRAECVADGEPLPDEDEPFQRLLADLVLTAQTPYRRSAAAPVVPVDDVDDAAAQTTESPGIDWEAWVRRFRQVLELAPSGGSWGYTFDEVRCRRAILRGDVDLALK